MGINSSKKTNTTLSHDNCSCKMYNACNHCCNTECLGEKYLEKKRTSLAITLKQYHCEYLTNTIMEYLANLEIIQFQSLPYHNKYLVYIHSTTVNIWPKLPCIKWREYSGFDSTTLSELKIVVLGHGGVGKSALVIRLVTDTFFEEYDPTIEDTYRKCISINGQSILMDILDTAGREEYTTLQDQWLREGDFFLICFALNDYLSYEEAILLRERLLKTLDDKDFGMMFVGTKGDLLYDKQSENRSEEWGNYRLKPVDRNMVIQQAMEWDVPYIETSSKDKKNVEFVFQQIFYELWIQSEGQIHADQ
eukprot:231480_1